MVKPFAMNPLEGSPVSDDGRGLKLLDAAPDCLACGGSPVSDDGRGLKHFAHQVRGQRGRGSPVSDDGRGLKQMGTARPDPQEADRPSAMTGAD